MRLIVMCFCLIGLVACTAPTQDGGTPKKRKGMYLSISGWGSESQQSCWCDLLVQKVFSNQQIDGFRKQ